MECSVQSWDLTMLLCKRLLSVFEPFATIPVVHYNLYNGTNNATRWWANNSRALMKGKTHLFGTMKKSRWTALNKALLIRLCVTNSTPRRVVDSGVLIWFGEISNYSSASKNLWQLKTQMKSQHFSLFNPHSVLFRKLVEKAWKRPFQSLIRRFVTDPFCFKNSYKEMNQESVRIWFI